jgi:hypothetical protein
VNDVENVFVQDPEAGTGRFTVRGYNVPGANTDPDGDSTGTVIEVFRP